MKWFAVSAGVLFGVAHIGMIGLIANKQTLPTLNPPVGPYSSYDAYVSEDGYRISYKGNDPKVMSKDTYVDKKNGFFGIGGKTNIRKSNQYTMDGSLHLGGNSAHGVGKLTAKKLECIKAEGGGEQSGAIVGASMGAAAAPALSGIPFVGPILAGGVALFGGNKGADIGGEIALSLNDCEEEMTE